MTMGTTERGAIPDLQDSGTTHNKRGSAAQSWLLLGGLLLGLVLWSIRGISGDGQSVVMKPGMVVDAPFTLLTVDGDNLVCAMKEGIKGNACLYSSPGRPNVPVPPADKTLAPYLTTQRELFLVAGLFAQPAVAARYQQEPPQGKAISSLKRFTAECKIKLLGEVEPRLRWAPEGSWGPPAPVWAAVPVKCRVVER